MSKAAITLPATLDPEERAALEKIGAEIRILPFEPGHSTSGLIERMNKTSIRDEPPRHRNSGIGKGSNCRAILEQIRAQKLAAEARLVVSDVFDAGILEIAREFGVPNAYLPPGRFRTRFEPAVEMELVKMLEDAGVDLVVLAGFMRVLKEPMLNAFPAPHHQHASFAAAKVSRHGSMEAGA